MKKATNVIRWIGAGSFGIMALATLGSGGILSALLFILGGLIIAPLGFVKKLREKLKLNKALSIVLAVVLLFGGIFAAPTAEIPEDNTENTEITAETSDESSDPDTTDTEETTEETEEISSEEETTSEPETTKEPETTAAPETTAETTTASTTAAITERVTEPVHTHSFSAATCTKPKTCSCGATEGNAAGHNWKAATCTTPKKCTVCGETSGSVTAHGYSNGTCTVCGANDPNYVTISYVLNTSSHKFHLPSCSRLPTKNREDTTMSREEIIQLGYEPCGYCHP